jgi:hypothetical protein
MIQLARSFTSLFNAINIMPTILGTDRGKTGRFSRLQAIGFSPAALLPSIDQSMQAYGERAGELRYNCAVYCDEIHNVVERSPGFCRLAAENHSDALTTTGYGVDSKP